jgi:hypothetical protein
VTHDNLRLALNAARRGGRRHAGRAGAVARGAGPDGKALCRWDYPQVLTSWGRLYSLLRAAVPGLAHRLGAAVTAVTQDEHRGHCHAEQRRTASGRPADRRRRHPLGRARPAGAGGAAAYVGYIAWRGVCDEAVLSHHTRDTLFGHFGFGLPDGEQMISYPVAGALDSTAAGERRCNFVWYRPVAAGADLAALMTDADGRHHPEGIAPQAVSWRCIAAMRQAARERLAPQYAEVVEKTAMPFLQPIYDLVSPRLAFGRVALLGDAAFVARPAHGHGRDQGRRRRACAGRGGGRAWRHAAGAAALRAASASPSGVSWSSAAARWVPTSKRHAQQHAAHRDPDSVMRQTAIDARDFQPIPQAA